MTTPNNKIVNPDPERMAILRSLPIEVKETITGEEAAAFLNSKQCEARPSFNEQFLTAVKNGGFTSW